MSEHNDKERDKNPNKPPGRKRRRLPVRAFFLLDDSLAANDQHPLAASPPAVREASRLRLIASVLARLASAGMEAG
ncbi:hypothetical protein [Planctomicrobium sp. SH527]|uniref:hypothetical protein n=1 Tax=Planctomicrobium sp. SH527 TaxID=3448123 RepID=UPI003F5C1407